MSDPHSKIKIVLAILPLLAVMTHPAIAEEEEPPARRFYVSVGMGFDFSRGDYGDVDANGDEITTDSAAVPIFTKWEWEPFTFRLAVPFLVIDGSDQVRSGTDGAEGNAGAVAQDRTDYGLGDVTTSLTYTYYPTREQRFVPTVDLSTRVKIPTATSGLGTGNADVTLQVELSKTIARVTGFVGTGYRFRGGSAFDNTWLAFTGMSVRVMRALSVGVAYDYREASNRFSDDASEISPYLSWRMSERVRLNPYGVIGLSDGSPDWGVGSTISYEF